MNVLMPQLGETVAEGTVANWHKKVGDTVAVDELLFDVETDKVSMEVPVDRGGRDHENPGAGRHDGGRRHRARGHRERRRSERVSAGRAARGPCPAVAARRIGGAHGTLPPHRKRRRRGTPRCRRR